MSYLWEGCIWYLEGCTWTVLRAYSCKWRLPLLLRRLYLNFCKCWFFLCECCVCVLRCRLCWAAFVFYSLVRRLPMPWWMLYLHRCKVLFLLHAGCMCYCEGLIRIVVSFHSCRLYLWVLSRYLRCCKCSLVCLNGVSVDLNVAIELMHFLLSLV